MHYFFSIFGLGYCDIELLFYSTFRVYRLLESFCDLPLVNSLTTWHSVSELSLCLTLLQNICATLKNPCDPNCLGNIKAIIKKWKSVESVICMIICCNVNLQD